MTPRVAAAARQAHVRLQRDSGVHAAAAEAES